MRCRRSEFDIWICLSSRRTSGGFSTRRTERRRDDMIPAQFDYLTPATLDEAVGILSQHPDEAKVLAGGHSLIPALKIRLATPPILVDIRHLKGPADNREPDGQIRIGAMTTHYNLESSDRLREICPLLPECAAQIGDVQVRNKGTIGGSLAHADPAGDWPAAIMALDAEIVVVGSGGERVIKADDFFVDMLTTALGADEILREIRAPVTGNDKTAYMKAAPRSSGFAVVGVAVRLAVNSSGTCSRAAIGITGVTDKAYRPVRVEQMLTGKRLDTSTIQQA